MPGINWPYLRFIRVTFDGLRGKDGSRAFESDGTQEKLRIACRVEQTRNSVPNPSQIRLWNISKDTRSSFQRSETKVTIEAGWKNQGVAMVFSGSLLTALSNRTGADIVTTLHAISGHDPLVTTPFNNVFPPRMRVADAVRRLASMLEGITIGPIKGINQVIGSGGWTGSDDVRVTLDRLAREFGFSWTIINDIFQAVGDETVLGNGPIIKSPYLIEVNPILAGPRQLLRGVMGKCTFNAALKPGDTVTIQSSIENQNNGEFSMHWLAHNLDCYTPQSFITEFAAYSRKAERAKPLYVTSQQVGVTY